MGELTSKTGILDRVFPFKRLGRSPHSTHWSPDEEGKSPCHYCLEPLAQVEVDTRRLRVCPICRHSILTHLLGTHVHLFNRRQQWDLLANEMAYIWNWEYWLLKGFQSTMCGLPSDQYTEAKDEFVKLGDAKRDVLAQKEVFLGHPGDMEALIPQFLENYPEGGGNFAKDFLKSRKWRDLAKELSGECADKREILDFQIEMVKGTSWGAFGFDVSEKGKTLLLLEARLSRF